MVIPFDPFWLFNERAFGCPLLCIFEGLGALERVIAYQAISKLLRMSSLPSTLARMTENYYFAEGVRDQIKNVFEVVAYPDIQSAACSMQAYKTSRSRE